VELAKWTLPIISRSREPYEAKVCAVSRTDGIATRGGRSSGLMTPRRTTYLAPKGRGDKSMLVKWGTVEDVYAVVLQRLSDMAKTGLSESCATSPRAGFSSQRREVRKNRPLGHPTYRMAKALGDHSLLGTREMS